MSRPPSPPPELSGFTYLQALGTGGFADVFLYEQQMPRRRVAVKVLLAERITGGAAQEFTDEANVMAMLSTHPAIVTIYQAGVADDGRPYLVMEYCPRPNLQVRARREPFSVAEALRVGVQVAGAVETAHRAGVLHRDIKPANILVTEYNRPALTDFGIASTVGAVSDAAGMSIPWSPPESFEDPPRGDARSDVYALGATVYTLLAGRSPFERVGERNSSADLIERIERAGLPRLDRADSPESLQRLLERAMAKNRDDRFPSAVAFARALQKVQIELSHSVTPIDIVDDQPSPEEHDDDSDGLTRVRRVVSIEPDAGSTRPSATTRPVTDGLRPDPAPGSAGSAGPPAPGGAVEETVRRAATPTPPAPEAGIDDRTLLRAPRVLSPDAPGPAAAPAAPAPATAPTPPARGAEPSDPTEGAGRDRRRTRRVVGVIVAVVVVALAIVGLNLAVAALPVEPEPAPSSAAPVPQDVLSSRVPAPDGLVGSREGEAVSFSWTNPQPEDGDTYIWRVVTLDADHVAQVVAEPRAQLTASGEACIEVLLRRADGRASDPVRGCVP